MVQHRAAGAVARTLVVCHQRWGEQMFGRGATDELIYVLFLPGVPNWQVRRSAGVVHVAHEQSDT